MDIEKRNPEMQTRYLRRQRICRRGFIKRKMTQLLVAENNNARLVVGAASLANPQGTIPEEAPYE